MESSEQRRTEALTEKNMVMCPSTVPRPNDPQVSFTVDRGPGLRNKIQVELESQM